MKSQVDTLESVIHKHGQRPVAVNDLMYWFAFDSMADFGFGLDLGGMRNMRWVDGAFYMRSAITLLGPFSPAIWIPRLAFAFIPGIWKANHWFKMLAFADSCVETRMKVRHFSLYCSTY